MYKAGTEEQYLFTNTLSSISTESLLGNDFTFFSTQVSYCCSSGYSFYDREVV